MPGYSQTIVKRNRDADPANWGVKLGKYCIAKDIPVAHVAEFFGVSRQAVYNWFTGFNRPTSIFAEAIQGFLKRAK
jgi:hypothetical protein